MRKIINSMQKHKGILIGLAIALVFVVSLVGTMGGNDDDYYYNDTMGYGSTSGFNCSISSVMMDATTAGVDSIGGGKSFSKGNTVINNYEMGDSNVNTESIQIENSETNISSEVNFGDKIIYSGSVNIKSGDIPKTLGIIRNAVESNGGYITSIDTGNENYGNITARVPSENFDKLVNDENIEKGNTVRRSISSKDVSLEYSDEQAELETLRIKEERILEYFKSATDVETMLRLETELQRVRSDISASEKHLRMMDSYVSYSEVNFYVNSRYSKPDEGAPFFERVKYTVEETLHTFKELSIGIVLTVIKLIPLAIYGTLFFFVIRAIVRFRRKRKKAKENTLAKEDTEENSND